MPGAKVISLEMEETEMGNRGSKSNALLNQINLLKKIIFSGSEPSTSTCLRFPEIVYKNVDKEKLKILLRSASLKIKINQVFISAELRSEKFDILLFYFYTINYKTTSAPHEAGLL